ncbi:MAG TPA: universal stress protein [bacterium]|nr:universal stress protein [bacterium]
MYKHVLVPLDGSELAETALPYAGEIAGRLGSKVTIIYVSEPEKPDPFPRMHRSYMDRMVAATQREAAKYLDKKAGTTQATSEILKGNAAEKIVDYADAKDAGLIVMTTHGRTGVKRWALGSVAEKVVRASVKPVFLIRGTGPRPARSKKGAFLKALVPLDGSKAGESALPQMAELAAKLNTELILLQVLPLGFMDMSPSGYGWVMYREEAVRATELLAKEYLDEVGARLMNRGVTAVRSEVRFGDAAQTIIEFADEAKVNVVAMSTHGSSGIRRWVFGNVADRVLHEGKTPVLLVKAAEG